ncbi:MAG: glycosyltransferase, partial [Muribaculaceae bacterium]|nr:glycosyltransferase [Muribaculaceae bacterium]
MPEISIIVPVYNAQDFLGECIESVLSQSFSDWELILVDDSSSDSSLAICRSYAAADRRIIVMAAEKGGVSAARNKGIRASTGRFISFLDSDDTLLPDALSALRKHASDRSIVVGQYINTAIHPGVPAMDMPDSARTTSSEDAVVRTLYQDSLYHNAAVAKLYPRGIFDGNGFEEKRRYEDLESCPRFYLKAESVVMLKTPVYWG